MRALHLRPFAATEHSAPKATLPCSSTQLLTKNVEKSRSQGWKCSAASTDSETASVRTLNNADGTITYSFDVLDFGAESSERAAANAETPSVASLPIPGHINNTPNLSHSIIDPTVRATEDGKKLQIPTNGPSIASMVAPTHPHPSEVLANGRKKSGGNRTLRKGTGLDEALELDFTAVESNRIVRTYSYLCRGGHLEGALSLLKESIRAGRKDVLRQLKHFEFLRPAAKQRAVRAALRFVQLLPREFVDTRTYNMLLTVCAEAKDVKSALRAADMLKGTGRKLDTILCTNLMKVCAAAGDSDCAFKVFEEMRSSNLKLENQVFATLMAACSRSMTTGGLDRRARLVLLERAFGLIGLMDDARIQPDVIVWNSLITMAGRAGQLQRSFSALEEMISRGCRPNARTYAAVIDACAKAGDRELALRVYRKARREGHVKELVLYSAVINACTKDKSTSDLDEVMSIYADLQREDVAPDSALYGSLIMAAGKSENLDLALVLQEEMLREGLTPCVGTESALMTVYVQHGEIERARQIYRRLKAMGSMPHVHAINAMINAYAKSNHLGDAVSLVTDMIDAGVEPDAFTFAGVLSACRRADEAELAIDVYRAMRRQNVKMDEVHALLLLRMCYSRLRQQWTPYHAGAHAHGSTLRGSSPPSSSSTPPSVRHRQERLKLMQALDPSEGFSRLCAESHDVPWQAYAFQIYRAAMSSGVAPSMQLLNVALACLRVPWAEANDRASKSSNSSSSSSSSSPSSSRATASNLASQIKALHADIPDTTPVQRKIGIESVYHVQALSMVEDAIVSGLLPSFQVDDGAPIDLRDMLPAVAEVYTLTVISALQRQVDARRHLKNRCTFVVPSYDGRKVFLPSRSKRAVIDPLGEREGGLESVAKDMRGQNNGVIDDLADDVEEILESTNGEDGYEAASRGDPPRADARTGLGVAGVLRRLRLWARERSLEGVIIVEPGEITRWAKMICREVEARSASALALQKPYGRRHGGGSGRGSMGLGGVNLLHQSYVIRSSGL